MLVILTLYIRIPSIEATPTGIVEEKVISPSIPTEVYVYVPTVTTEVPIIEPTPIVLPAVTPIPMIEVLEGFYTGGTINVESMLKDLQILTCSTNCTVQEVTGLLSYNENSWIVVQDRQILYTHSGRFTSLPWDYEFGEALRQLYLNNSLQDTLICISDSKCLQVVDFLVADYESRSISSFNIFPLIQDTSDFVLVTCIEPRNRYSSERLFILLRRIN